MKACFKDALPSLIQLFAWPIITAVASLCVHTRLTGTVSRAKAFLDFLCWWGLCSFVVESAAGAGASNCSLGEQVTGDSNLYLLPRTVPFLTELCGVIVRQQTSSL